MMPSVGTGIDVAIHYSSSLARVAVQQCHTGVVEECRRSRHLKDHASVASTPLGKTPDTHTLGSRNQPALLSIAEPNPKSATRGQQS